MADAILRLEKLDDIWISR